MANSLTLLGVISMLFATNFRGTVDPCSRNNTVPHYRRVLSKTTHDCCTRMSYQSKTMKNKLLIVTGLAVMMCLGAANAAEYKLAIQPVLPRAEMGELYKPLADYLSAETGDTITLQTFSSFKSYFANMKRKKGFDLVLDAAHFTNYRVEKMNYSVLVKLPDTVSFSLVTGPDLMVFDADELVPYKIATMVSPAMGDLRLRELYPDVDNSPTIVRAKDSVDAIKQVLDGRADAAMVPTPMVGQYDGLNTVLTTDPLPHMALSISPDAPQTVADKIKKAMLSAANTEKGKEMLAVLKFQDFVASSNEDYAGFGNILQLTKRNKPVLTKLKQ
jgi:hypothetical protein